jgi:hypothetical protein
MVSRLIYDINFAVPYFCSFYLHKVSTAKISRLHLTINNFLCLLYSFFLLCTKQNSSRTFIYSFLPFSLRSYWSNYCCLLQIFMILFASDFFLFLFQVKSRKRWLIDQISQSVSDNLRHDNSRELFDSMSTRVEVEKRTKFSQRWAASLMFFVLAMFVVSLQRLQARGLQYKILWAKTITKVSFKLSSKKLVI